MTTADAEDRENEKITLSVDAATSARLKAAAALGGVSVDEYCQEAIETHLDEDEKYRAPVKLTQEYVDRFSRIRGETASLKKTERESEPSGRLAAINRLAALRKEMSGGKASRENSADDIRRMREERALQLERAANGRGRRRKLGD